MFKKLPIIPASFFAMTLGFAETGNAWRNATAALNAPGIVGEIFQVLAVLSFFVWGGLFLNKWISQTAAAREEFRDPIQASFIALIPESIILISLALHPYNHPVALAAFWLGSATNLLYGAYRLSRMWVENRTPEQTTPNLFLIYAASVLVNAIAAGVFGYILYGWVLFGIGAISWLVLDSVIKQQLVTGMLPAKTRNFMGIYMAPPVVALVAYQVLSGNQASIPVIYILLGYSLFITVTVIMSFRWLREQPFAPGYWAYTFGISTLAQGLLILAETEKHPIIQFLAVGTLALATALLGFVLLATLQALASNTYFPPRPASVPAAEPGPAG